MLLPVAGEFFLLTLPFIERGYRKLEVLGLDLSGNPTYRDLGPSLGSAAAKDWQASRTSRLHVAGDRFFLL